MQTVTLILLTFIVGSCYGSSITKPTAAVTTTTTSRPPYITKALETNDVVHYLGVGSNLLKEKLTNRGLNGTTIHFNSFKGGTAKDHRLAFNLRGFLPLEPAMGGIEPCEGAILQGSLVELPAQEYQKIWLSEGGGSPKPGYEEYLVQVTPNDGGKPVTAIALRAAPHCRLSMDASPSQRYMDIIVRGAKELGLDNQYIDSLMAVTTAQVHPCLKFVASKNYIFARQMFLWKVRFITMAVSRLMWYVYYTDRRGQSESFMKRQENNDHKVAISSSSGRLSLVRTMDIMVSLRLGLSQLSMTCILLPFAIMGMIIEMTYKVLGKQVPDPFGLTRPSPPTTTAATTTKIPEVAAGTAISVATA